MDKQAQDKLWNELSEESKEKIYEDYMGYKISSHSNEQYKASAIEDMFGSHNLNPKPQIKTWEDVEEYYTHIDIELDKATKSLCDYSHCSIQLLQKCIATLKIAKLIELGYGGMVSEEEWKDADIVKHCIIRDGSGLRHGCFTTEYEFLAFHTSQQFEEFMSHESNRQLVKQYFLM